MNRIIKCLALLVFWMISVVPAVTVPGLAQAPPRLVFTPSAPLGLSPAPGLAGTLTFHPVPPPASAALLQAQVTSLSSRVTVLSAQVAAAAPTIWGQPFSNRHTDTSPDGPHMVWLHELSTQGEWGKSFNMDPFDGSTSPSVAQMTQQIHEAKSSGIDGDAIDLQGSDHANTSMVENCLTAADQDNILNMGASNGKGVCDFHPFLQFDFATYPQDTPTIVAQIKQSVRHPSYARHLGMPIVSTYAGEGGTYAFVQGNWQAIKASLAAQNPPIYIWFQPFFNIRDPNGSVPVEPQAVATAQEAAFLKPFAQGAMLFGTGFAPAASTQSGLPAAEIYSAALRAQGLTWWGSVSSGSSGIGHSAPSRYYNENYGFEGLDHQETSIIQNQQCQDVMIVTGNDRAEGDALTNAPSGPGSPWNYYTNSTVPDFWKSTLGTQSELLCYNQWYKTSVRPLAASDYLWMSCCTQQHSLTLPDPLGAMGPVGTEDGAALPPDTIYVDTSAVQTETLTVTDGPVTWAKSVPPGFQHNRFGPYVPGAVLATLKNPNTGQVLVSLPGEPVLTQAQAQAFGVYDWVPWTGVAHD